MKLQAKSNLYILEFKAFYREYKKHYKVNEINVILILVFISLIGFILYIANLFGINKVLVLNLISVILIFLNNLSSGNNQFKTITGKRMKAFNAFPLERKTIIGLKLFKFELAKLADLLIVVGVIYPCLILFGYGFIMTTTYFIFIVLVSLIFGDIVKVINFNKFIKGNKLIIFQETMKAFLLGGILSFAEIFIRTQMGNISFELNTSFLTQNYLTPTVLVITLILAIISRKIKLNIFQRAISLKKASEHANYTTIEKMIDKYINKMELKVRMKQIVRNNEMINKIASKMIFYNILLVSYIIISHLTIGHSFLHQNVTALILFTAIITANYNQLFLSILPIDQEGKMVERYVLADFKINKIVFSRVLFNSIATSITSLLPVFILCILVTGGVFQYGWLVVIIFSYGTVLSFIGEYYRVLGTVYLSDLMSQDKLSALKNIVWSICLLSFLIYGSVILQIVEVKNSIMIIVLGFSLLNLLICGLFFLKIKKDRKEFYGEFSEGVR